MDQLDILELADDAHWSRQLCPTQSRVDCLVAYQANAFQMRCLRRISGISLRQHQTNVSIRELCQMESIRNLATYGRHRWLGHVARMPDERLPKRLLFGTRGQTAPSKPGRMIQCWPEYVRDDLNKLYIAYSWFKLAQDREEWRDTIMTVLDHT